MSFEKLCQQRKLILLLELKQTDTMLCAGTYNARLATIDTWYALHKTKKQDRSGYRSWDEFNIVLFIAGAVEYAKR